MTTSERGATSLVSAWLAGLAAQSELRKAHCCVVRKLKELVRPREFP